MYASVTIVGAYLSDRYDTRGIPIMIISTLSVAGFALYLSMFTAVYISILQVIVHHPLRVESQDVIVS